MGVACLNSHVGFVARVATIACVIFAPLIFPSLSIAQNLSVSGSKTKIINLKKSRKTLPAPSVTVSKEIDGTIQQQRTRGLDKRDTTFASSAIQKQDEKKIALNFEDAPIREVIKNICEFAGVNYIIENNVKGFVTIRTLNPVPISSSLDLLDQLLIVNSLTRVKIGEYWRFFPLSNVRKEPLPVYVDKSASTFIARERYQIAVLSFRYVSASKVGEIIKPFLSKEGSISLLPRANLMIIVERGAKLDELKNLVSALDIDSLDAMQVKIFELKNGYALDISSELTSIFTSMGYGGVGKGSVGISFIPLERINAVLMVNPFPNLYPSINSWVSKLDMGPIETEEVATFIYKVQNGDAVVLAKILETLYKDDLTGTAVATRKKTKRQKTKLGVRTDIISASTEGPLKVIAHANTNSIIIRSTRKNYPGVLETLKKLDKMPQQVLIEVLITELTLSDQLEFGVEWAFHSNNGKSFGSQNNGSLGTGGATGTTATNLLAGGNFNPVGANGLSFFTRNSGNVMALLHTLASDSKLEVRASPVLMTSDNKSASIDITNEVPISTTSESQGGTITQNIQYRSVGIRLSVTPKINDEKFVTLNINQEISQIDDSRTAQFSSNAVPLLRRQARTTVVVKDEETLVIGGMINKQKGGGRSGVPWLSKIPILGWLFGTTTKSDSKTELMIFITPHVVASVKDAEVITNEVEKKISELKENIKSARIKDTIKVNRKHTNPTKTDKPKKKTKETQVM